MPVRPLWTRRQFLARAAVGTASLPALSRRALPAQFRAEPQTFVGPSAPPTTPEPSPGGIAPLLESNTARPLRYTPDGLDFLIRNGREFFNRPLYGLDSAFRVDAGDLPEFSLYLPGHGGNLRLGMGRIQAPAIPGSPLPSGPAADAKWLFEAADITTRYRPGRMLYEIRDPLLGKGLVQLELVTQATGSGIHLRVEVHSPPPDLDLVWAFGGLSGRKGGHNGDLGAEIVPISAFFQLDAQECHANVYTLRGATALLEAPAADLRLLFPPGSRLHLADAPSWNSPWSRLKVPVDDPALPILVGSVALSEASPLHLLLTHIPKPVPGTVPLKPVPQDPATLFAARGAQLTTLASAVTVTTPDPYLNTAVPAITLAAESLWDPATQSVLLGAVAEHTAAPGWSGPCALDALGHHDRMRLHLRHWIALQNTTPLPKGVDPDSSATGPADPGSHLTRKNSLLHTQGEIPCTISSSGARDMTLPFFETLLRHLRWTGDLAFAREAWPALTLHLDRQFRLFRRAFPNPGPRPPLGQEVLPLYEAYASIPASDNLQYNGGGATHATASNYFLNRNAAIVARLLREDALPFDEEANLIQVAMAQLLWMPPAGAFAESKDLLGPQALYTSPSLTTVCAAVDAELPTPRQSWQIAAERLSALRRIPVHGPGTPAGNWFVLPNSDWLPYTWPLTNVLLAENLHTALALWQAGMPDGAYALFGGSLLDSMYRGLCPGNLHFTSSLDPHRGETDRETGDAIGLASRALIEGLFGILPDLLRATLTVRPGFPSTWNEAALHHPDFDLNWRRDGLHETLELTSRLPHPVALTLILPARTTSDPVVLSNGKAYPFAFDTDATGGPTLLLTNFPAASSWTIDIRWHGRSPTPIPALATCQVNDPVPLPRGILLAQIDDPQACLQNGRAALPGHHLIFARIRQESCQYWLPIALDIHPETIFSVTTTADIPVSHEPVDLSHVLRHNLTEILTRPYIAPRSPFCSLALPSGLLGGWKSDSLTATIDDTGLRSYAGTLHTTLSAGPGSSAPRTPAIPATDLPFLTPAGSTRPNALFLSHWEPDIQRIEISLAGKASSLYLLMTGTTFPQASRTEHGVITVLYTDGSTSHLALVNPSTWWPIEADYFLDEYVFRADDVTAVLPSVVARVDLRTGKTRNPDPATFKGQGGRPVPGGAATVLHLPLHSERTLSSIQVECTLYGVVLALLGLTLAR